MRRMQSGDTVFSKKTLSTLSTSYVRGDEFVIVSEDPGGGDFEASVTLRHTRTGELISGVG